MPVLSEAVKLFIHSFAFLSPHLFKYTCVRTGWLTGHIRTIFKHLVTGIRHFLRFVIDERKFGNSACNWKWLVAVCILLRFGF